MIFNLDITIFAIFMTLTLLVGILSSTGVKNIAEFALGGRNFSTPALSATIIATWMSGSVFSYTISETNNKGALFAIPLLCNFFVFLFISFILLPRMGEFLGKLSIAEAMGEIYGKHSRFIVSIMGIISCTGIIAAQFKVSGELMAILFNVNTFEATLMSCMIVVFYSSFGGIRAVTFTDILQFFAFATIIPIVTFSIWQSFNDHSSVFNNLTNSHIFDWQELFNYNNPSFFSTLSLLLYFSMPHMNPTLFQRISMAKNISQASKAFLIAGAFCALIELLICCIGALLFATDNSLASNGLFSFLLDNYSHAGFKGFIIAGIMAMIMSTSDSYINSSSVIITNDFCKNFKLLENTNELLLSRIFSLIVGILAFILAFNSSTILSLLMTTIGIYNAIVTAPFIMAVLGFRSTIKSFLVASCTSLTVVILGKFYFTNIGIDSGVLGVITSFITLFASHYLLKQPGGFVGLKDGGKFLRFKQERKLKRQIYLKKIKNFNFIEFCLKNKPENEITYPLFALFSIASIYSGMFTIDEIVRADHADLMDRIFHSVIIFSSMFLTYPIWPASLKSDKFIAVAWHIGLFYILIFASILQIIVSNFDSFQAMIFMINIIILGMLSRWYTALLLTIFGTILSIQFFKYYAGLDSLPGTIGSIKLQLMYALLLGSSALIAFIRPKQEELCLSEERMNYLDQKVLNQKSEIAKLTDMKNEFLRNIPHESNTPLTGVTSLVESLCISFDRLSREDIYSIIKDIEGSSERLKSYIGNIIDLSRLHTSKYEFKIAENNLSELIQERFYICKRLYLKKPKAEKLQFCLHIEDNVIFPCDVTYITKVIDNIIINSIQYSKEGSINIYLKQTKDKILFKVSDEGIGIPENEMLDIFSPFIVSSKTRSLAGGRGIGLALAKEVINLHNGKIWAENNKPKGTIFSFELSY
ncbi:MAG: hypothetical protein HRU35_01595 [Rickettsiaceae bacterium]|nr:hypothetical protein [Rickettsiaceae bacterium]